MSKTSRIHWPLAQQVARWSSAELPSVTRPEAVTAVADLRCLARQAHDIVSDFLGLPSYPASPVQVVDWAGWRKAVAHMTEATLTVGPVPKDTALASFRRVGYGLATGLVLGKVAGRLLGQYDAFSGDERLYLVAPSIVEHERRLRLIPHDFRLWVCLHEQTHAAQFRAATWLRHYFLKRIAVLLAEESSGKGAIAAWLRSGDLADLMLSPEQRQVLDQASAAMTFLEGHADYVADQAGESQIPSVRALRRAFERTPTANLLGKVAPSLDKAAQYRTGLAFCRYVAQHHGSDALQAAFNAADNLPTGAELATPQLWIERIHG